jgi:hypothetical protein
MARRSWAGLKPPDQRPTTGVTGRYFSCYLRAGHYGDRSKHRGPERVGKPVSTFPHHALARRITTNSAPLAGVGIGDVGKLAFEDRGRRPAVQPFHDGEVTDASLKAARSIAAAGDGIAARCRIGRAGCVRGCRRQAQANEKRRHRDCPRSHSPMASALRRR